MDEVRFTGALERFYLWSGRGRFFAALFRQLAPTQQHYYQVGIAVKHHTQGLHYPQLDRELTAFLLCDTPFCYATTVKASGANRTRFDISDVNSTNYTRLPKQPRAPMHYQCNRFDASLMQQGIPRFHHEQDINVAETYQFSAMCNLCHVTVHKGHSVERIVRALRQLIRSVPSQNLALMTI